MKTIKSIFFVTFLLVSSAILAQTADENRVEKPMGPPPIPTDEQIEMMVSNLAQEISLTEKQSRSILELHKAHFKVVREKLAGEEKPSREEMETLRKDFEEKVKAELSKKQRIKYVDFMKKLHQHRPEQ